MPNTTNQNKFSIICGVSRQAIGKAVKEKLIKMAGKKVNLDHRITCEYFYKHTGKQLTPKIAEKATPAKKKKVATTPPVKTTKKKPPVEKITAPTEPDDDIPDSDPDDGYKLPRGIKSFEDITIHNIHLIPIDLVKKWKELEATKTAKQTRDGKRGKLIERSVVETAFNEIHTVDTNQWKTLEDRIIPELCGLFKIQDGSKESFDARKIVAKEVTKVLKFTKRLIDEFLTANKETAK